MCSLSKGYLISAPLSLLLRDLIRQIHPASLGMYLINVLQCQLDKGET